MPTRKAAPPVPIRGGGGDQKLRSHNRDNPPAVPTTPPLPPQRQGSSSSGTSGTGGVPCGGSCVVSSGLRGVIEYLHGNATSVDELFKVVSDKARVAVLKSQTRAASAQVLAKILPNQDIHTVAGMLKATLKEMPEPLMSYRLYDEFIAAYNETRSMDPAALSAALLGVMGKLSGDDVETLASLLDMLRAVKTVPMAGLAYTFGPLLLRSPDSSMDMMKVRRYPFNYTIGRQPKNEE